MGIFFLTSDLREAARGQKHPSDAENGMKESIYCNKFLMKVAQQPQKPQNGSNQIWATTLRAESYDFWAHKAPKNLQSGFS